VNRSILYAGFVAKLAALVPPPSRNELGATPQVRHYAEAILNSQLADIGLPVGCQWQSSHPMQAAMDAVAKWTFTPATEAGVPMASTVLVPVNFAMDDPDRLELEDQGLQRMDTLHVQE